MKLLVRCSIVLLALGLFPGCLAFHRGAMPGEPKDAQFAEVEGARIRYVDVGQGPAVVLIHGYASSLETWAALLPQLAKTHRVLALDLKGFGWSDRPEGDYSPKAEAKVVEALMKQRGIDRAAVVAHSWGSSVALALALDAPERVEKLVLYDAWIYESQIPAFFVMSRAHGVGEALFALFYDERPDEKTAAGFYDPNLVTEKLIEDIERAMDRPGTKAAALAAARGQRFDQVEGEYRRIEAPALLLWGNEDRVSTPRIGERLSRDLKHARLVVYPRCGHFPMIEAAPASNDEVVRFLAEASR